jgi:hypothetical protein
MLRSVRDWIWLNKPVSEATVQKESDRFMIAAAWVCAAAKVAADSVAPAPAPLTMSRTLAKSAS